MPHELRTPDREDRRAGQPRRRGGRRVLAPALVSLLAVAGGAQAQGGAAGSGQAGAYVGAFAGLGAVDVRTTDAGGFSGSNGVPGQTFEYDGTGLAVGVVAGRYFHLGPARLRFEADGAFGGLPAAARQLDPVGLDETASSDLRWVGTARVGVRRSLGRAGVFVAGGGVGCRNLELVHRSRRGDGRARAGGPRRFLRRAVDAGRVGRGGGHRCADGRRLDPPTRRPVHGLRRGGPPGGEPAWRERRRLRAGRTPEPLPLRRRPALRSPPSGPRSASWPVMAARFGLV